MARPETRYTRNGGVHLAYQVVGDGPVDLVYVAGFISNLELQWEDPAYRRLLERLAGFSRLIVFDKRGSGLSDPVVQVPSLEQRMDDVRAVMDAAGSRQAFLLGASEGGAMSVLFAATYPERTRGLILYGAYPSYSFAHPLGEVQEFLAAIDAEWGTGFLLRYFAPDFLSDPHGAPLVGSSRTACGQSRHGEAARPDERVHRHSGRASVYPSADAGDSSRRRFAGAIAGGAVPG